MWLWRKLTSLGSQGSTANAARFHNQNSLPSVTEEHFHRNFADPVSPTPGDGGKKFDEFIPAWNNGDYEAASKLLNEAIKLGLEDPDKSSAYSYLGQIYIKQGQLEKAVSSLLMCLKTRVRPSVITWETAMRLYYIYSEVGDSELATRFLSLARDSNSMLNIPRKHLPNVELEICELTRRKVPRSH